MIRRAITTTLGKLSSKMKSDLFVQEMVPILKNLVNDDQDSVRVLCIDSIVEISRNFNRDLNKTTIVPILIHMVRDRAWKVRIKISNNFAGLAEAMKQEIADSTLLNIFSSLLGDAEGEVRTAATQNYGKFLAYVSASKYVQVIPQVLELLRDTIPLVRVAAFEIVSRISGGLPKDEVKGKLINAILDQFKTENDNEVKIEMARALTACGVAMGTDFFTKITNQDVANLLKQPSWRVRKEIYTMIIEVSVNSKSNQLFEVHFQEFFLSYLSDKVFQVRMHGNSLLPVT
jgi:serine/threonine-protein phosphatase 2A regulatory subunit A